MCQWFLDRMDSEWLNNKKRFENKIDLMNMSFVLQIQIHLK